MIDSELVRSWIFSIYLQQDDVTGQGFDLADRMVFKDLVWDVEGVEIPKWWVKGFYCCVVWLGSLTQLMRSMDIHR